MMEVPFSDDCSFFAEEPSVPDYPLFPLVSARILVPETARFEV